MNIKPSCKELFKSCSLPGQHNQLSQATPLPEWLKTLHRKQPATAQRSSTGLLPFQWPRSSLRLTPRSTRSAELSVRTLDAACLVAVVRTVVHLVTLLCSMDTGPIATLEFIWLAGHQSFKTTNSSISHTGLESFVWYLLATYL